MASEQASVLNKTRRKADTWDRIKFLVILGIITTAIVGSQVQPPFVTVAEALRDFLASTPGRLIGILFLLEVLRQVHYFISERSAGYHGFWQQRVFGNVEGGLSHLKPWTRFRVGRLIRWTVIIAIYAVAMDYFNSEIDSPLQAVSEAPRMFFQALPMFLQIFVMLAAVILQFVAIFWFLSRGGVSVIMPEEVKTRFKDVWGQDHVLDLIKENIAFLEKPDEIEAKGGYIPGGILLWGPPGTGKTLMAEAIAGETGRPYVFVDPGAFINMFMGVGILKVKSLYRKLRRLSLRHGGVIVFLDEADSLGNRGGLGTPTGTGMASQINCNGMHYASPLTLDMLAQNEQLPNTSVEKVEPKGWIPKIIMGMGGGGMGTLQALLTEMNGLTKPRGMSNRLRKILGFRPKPPPKYRILHILATNMPNALDPAMLRPGRIDRIYKVGYPSREGRKATLDGYLAKVQHNLTEEQVLELAVMTPYYTGAQIKDLVNEALILSIRDDRETIEWNDIWKAKSLKELGPPEDAEYIVRERHAVAVHEACHAVVAHLMVSHKKIDLATIERRGTTGGMVKPIAVEDRFTRWRSEYETEIMTFLASLAGERMFFDEDNSSGVSHDLQVATQIVAAMEGVYGMGEGITSLVGLPSHVAWQTPDPTEKVVGRMHDRVEKALKELYQRTWDTLDENREHVLAVAAALETKKTISGDEIAEIIGTPAGEHSMREPKGWQVIFDETNTRLNGSGHKEQNGGSAANDEPQVEDADVEDAEVVD
jgi:ATP-dependent Zn protease